MIALKDIVLVLLARNVNRSIPLYNLLIETKVLGRSVGIDITTDDLKKVLFSYDVSSLIKVRPTSDIIMELLKTNLKENNLYYKVGIVQMLYGGLKPIELAVLTEDRNVKIPREERLSIVEDLHKRNIITDKRYKELLKD
jgi:hypothetical protein